MLQKFLDEMVKLPDVWFVTNWQAIEWMKKPTPINQLSEFEPWNCKRQVCNLCWSDKYSSLVKKSMLNSHFHDQQIIHDNYLFLLLLCAISMYLRLQIKAMKENKHKSIYALFALDSACTIILD